tara:strand:+ start:251 stop:1009 length:759 start_codon:yes stop_codon:yes gene_type:complete
MFFSSQLNKIKNLKHCFFSRKDGVSEGIYNSLNCGLGSKDQKKNVIKNIDIVKKKLNFNEKILTLKQFHSNEVICIDSEKKIDNANKGDALITKFKNVAIGILTADCAPILICDPKKEIIAAIHSGWKGAFNGVIENTIDKFVKLNSEIPDLVVAIGPCIDQKNYEVDNIFYNNFLKQNKDNDKFFTFSDKQKYFFNIRNYINEKLKKNGVTNIDNIEMDTFSDKENFFSYRRALRNREKDYGRCISVILMS